MNIYKNIPDDPCPPHTFNIPPNNDNKIKKVHFNDTIAIINDDDNTNKSDNCVADDVNVNNCVADDFIDPITIINDGNDANNFNAFHHNIITDDKPDAAINDKYDTVINNGVDDPITDSVNDFVNINDSDNGTDSVNDTVINNGVDNGQIHNVDNDSLINAADDDSPMADYTGDNTITFDDATDDIDMSDITGRHIQIFESAKCRRHDKKKGKKRKVCVLSKTLQELQSWKKEIYNINKQSLQQQKPPLPSPNKHKFFKYKAPTLCRSKRLQAKVPADLDPNITKAELIHIPSIDEIKDPKLRKEYDTRLAKAL